MNDGEASSTSSQGLLGLSVSFHRRGGRFLDNLSSVKDLNSGNNTEILSDNLEIVSFQMSSTEAICFVCEGICQSPPRNESVACSFQLNISMIKQLQIV